MGIYVIDTTEFSFYGYDREHFESLPEAFKYIGEEMQENAGERQFEIHHDDGDSCNFINVDGRSFTTDEEEDE